MIRQFASAVIGCLFFGLLGGGCGKEDAISHRDLTAGPVLLPRASSPNIITPPVSWCEDLEAIGTVFDETRGDCRYKYLTRGIKYWQQTASVAFVGDVRPDCDGGVVRHCLPSEFGTDCLVICPFEIRNISQILYGEPHSISTLASFEPRVSSYDKSVLYHFDTWYPSNSWRVSGGSNLVFASRACFAEKYTGERDVYLIAGMYPVEGDTVFDIDDVTASVTGLQAHLNSSGFVVDEEARYAARCGFDSFKSAPSDNKLDADADKVEPVPVLPAPAR